MAGDPYEESQLDQDGNLRTVWLFPLKLESKTNFPILDYKLKNSFEQKTKQAKKLTDNELRRRAETSAKKPGNRSVVSTQYDRNPWVSEYAKRRANGIRQLCKRDAPFKNSKREPYLETHHITWLSRDGEDTLDNVVTLCPNCHRMMHILDKQSDKALLRKEIIYYK